MSQNKTVFPGVGPEESYGHNQSYTRNPSYSRPGGGNAKRTVFPEMDTPADNASAPDRGGQPRHSAGADHKPILGFLYSISRTLAGEYWPLYVGENVIGRNDDCDIVLNEATVSHKHVSLHINKMKKPEKVEATIMELGSSNGTLINDESVSRAVPVICNNGDIITVGENYELLLILIDPRALGLHLAGNFVEVAQQSASDFRSQRGGGGATRDEEDFPYFDGPDGPYNGGGRPTDGTVGMDSGSVFQRGGTNPMDQ